MSKGTMSKTHIRLKVCLFTVNPAAAVRVILLKGIYRFYQEYYLRQPLVRLEYIVYTWLSCFLLQTWHHVLVAIWHSETVHVGNTCSASAGLYDIHLDLDVKLCCILSCNTCPKIMSLITANKLLRQPLPWCCWSYRKLKLTAAHQSTQCWIYLITDIVHVFIDQPLMVIIVLIKCKLATSNVKTHLDSPCNVLHVKKLRNIQSWITVISARV